jgi:hypothetical protein
MQAGSIGQANLLSEVYSYYNANSQTIEGVLVKKFTKIFIVAGLVSTMDEFVSKFDSPRRLVGLGFSQAAIPQQVTCDSEDCREFFVPDCPATMAVVPCLCTLDSSESSPPFRTEGACFRQIGWRAALGCLPPIERRLYCRAHWSGHSNQRGNQGIQNSHLGSRLSGSRITSGSTEN